jgi:excisionase family DNA binding protein
MIKIKLTNCIKDILLCYLDLAFVHGKTGYHSHDIVKYLHHSLLFELNEANKSIYARIEHENLLDVFDVAHLLGVSYKTVLRYVKYHKIPGIKMNKMIFFDRKQIEKWIENKMINNVKKA